eukprot:3499286-Amphidinium_carterae.1
MEQRVSTLSLRSSHRRQWVAIRNTWSCKALRYSSPRHCFGCTWPLYSQHDINADSHAQASFMHFHSEARLNRCQQPSSGSPI